MAIEQIRDPERLCYEPGLSRVEEAVISSHFMEALATDRSLQLYGPNDFSSKQLTIDAGLINETLIPLLLRTSRRFAEQRAELALPRARQHFHKYGVTEPNDIRVEHEIAEALFDKHYLRGPRETCSRRVISDQVKELVENGKAIVMVIPALPFKFSSPLKSRGPDPDLGEVNFLLSLLEIVWTVELIYRKARPDLSGLYAHFIVVSDGSRFSEFVGEPLEHLEGYQHEIKQWIKRLGAEHDIAIVDYVEAVQKRLPKALLDAKASIAHAARTDYADRMWAVFDPLQMGETLRGAATVEPDPELNNREGRFIALFKSLLFTIRYRTLRSFVTANSPSDQYSEYYSTLYRELTAHMLYPYVIAQDELGSEGLTGALIERPEQLPPQIKESLRIAMLTEAWEATIQYLAEIKSDRELAADPIVVAFPDCLRWTIHAKPGQLALLTSHALGSPIQCWAGSGAFRRTKGGRIRLCTLPILALEGQGAIPVIVASIHSPGNSQRQPLFYLDPRISIGEISEFLSILGTTLTRFKTS